MALPPDWTIRTSISRFLTVSGRTLARVTTVAINPTYDGDGKTIRDVWAVTEPGTPDEFIEKSTFVSAIKSLQDNWEAFETAVCSQAAQIAQAVASAQDLGRVICDSPLWRQPVHGSQKYVRYVTQFVSNGQLTFYALRPLTLDKSVDYIPGVWRYDMALQDVVITGSQLVEPI